MRIVGVNGIATHGERNIDILLRALELRGYETVDVRLPKRHWFSARWGANDDAIEVAKRAEPGDILVAHSFGCLRAWYAHLVEEFAAIFCVAPAMSSSEKWLYPGRVHCFYSPSDWPVRFGSWLRFHPFGDAGNKGFDTDLNPGLINNLVDGSGHGDYFKGERLEALVEYIDRVAWKFRA